MRSVTTAMAVAVIFGTGSACFAQSGATDTSSCAAHLNTSENPTVGAVLNCLAEMQRDIDDLTAQLNESESNEQADDIQGIPSGAVVAFTQPCSDDSGWTPYAQATGRFMIGAGQDTHRAFRQWDQQLPTGGNQKVDLPLYDVEAIGGEVHHTVSLEEMPAHNHGGVTGPNSGSAILLGAGGGFDMIYGDWAKNLATIADGSGARRIAVRNEDTNHNHSVSNNGSTEPHNNMPPYIALYFCKKG